MKQLLLLLALIPFTFVAQEQENKSETKISVGLSFSPDYCYRTLKGNESNQWIVDQRNSTEIPKFGFTTGISFLFRLTDRFSLETGLRYADKGEKTKDIPGSFFGVGQIEPEFPSVIFYRYHYNYIDIPVKANYYLMNRRLKFFVSGGFSTNVFLYQKNTAVNEFEDGSRERSSSKFGGLSRFNFAVQGGIGAHFDLTDRLSFRLEPTYRRSITSIIDAPIKGYLYSFGANAGFYIKL